MIRALALITLTGFLTTNLFARSLQPGECIPQNCVCYTLQDADKIAEGLRYSEYCRYALGEYETFAYKNNTHAKNTDWWQEPSIIIGGLVISASVFGLLGYFIGEHK